MSRSLRAHEPGRSSIWPFFTNLPGLQAAVESLGLDLGVGSLKNSARGLGLGLGLGNSKYSSQKPHTLSSAATSAPSPGEEFVSPGEETMSPRRDSRKCRTFHRLFSVPLAAFCSLPERERRRAASSAASFRRRRS